MQESPRNVAQDNVAQDNVAQDAAALAPPLRWGAAQVTPEFAAAHAEAPAQPPSGGDFHAVLPVPDGSGDVHVVIGDVAGHGPEQTAQAEHMRELLSDCLSLGMAPAETLRAVNILIELDPHFAGFGTVFVGRVEAGMGRLTYASGGHEPGLIAAPAPGEAARVVQLEGAGPPVGAFPAELARFEQHEAAVPPGATLLLYTDGVSDAHPPGDRTNWFGVERLKRTLADFIALSPLHLVSGLLRRVARFCRGRFEDDVAILAIRRSHLPKPAARKVKHTD